VLYDAFAADEGLPWRITVHTQGYPATLLRCDSRDDVESHFIGQLKKACYLKHGVSQVDGLQTERDRKQLFLGLAEDNYEQFKQLNDKLMTCKEGNWFKDVPFSIYMVNPKVRDFAIQAPSTAVAAMGERTTSCDALCSFVIRVRSSIANCAPIAKSSSGKEKRAV
jgi:hypothetical protein